MSQRDKNSYSSQGTGAGYNDHTGQQYRAGYKRPSGGWWNQDVTYTAHCPDGYDGTPITKSMEANRVFSYVSQEDANNLARAMLRPLAETELNCTSYRMDFVSGEELFFVDGTAALFVQPTPP